EEEARRLREELEQLQQSLDEGAEMRLEYEGRRNRVGTLGGGTGTGTGTQSERAGSERAAASEGTGGFVMPLLPGQGARRRPGAPPPTPTLEGTGLAPLDDPLRPVLPGFGPLGPDPSNRRQAPGLIVGTELA